MKLLIVFFVLSLLFLSFATLFILRGFTRARADDIIHGIRPATEKSIKSIISCLSWSNFYITKHPEQDELRINHLLDMLKEMQHPHD